MGDNIGGEYADNAEYESVVATYRKVKMINFVCNPSDITLDSLLVSMRQKAVVITESNYFIFQENVMDVSQIAALATSLKDMQTRNEASTLVFKKALDNLY